eukprot:GFUD01042134.1.p1 GENE.GFUD01042134.1~~GFUD01042134.1.p1  ORF type:complete len:450 (-),score=90.24 GFUD01042134.1:44-1393(-)
MLPLSYQKRLFTIFLKIRLSLLPMVPPVLRSMFDVISDASPAETFPPVSLSALTTSSVPVSANTIQAEPMPMVSSPLKFSSEIRYKVKVREDGVLNFDDVVNHAEDKASGVCRFWTSSTSKICQGLVLFSPDIPSPVESKSKSAEIGKPSDTQGSSLLGSLSSPSNSWQPSTDSSDMCLSIKPAEGSMKRNLRTRPNPWLVPSTIAPPTKPSPPVQNITPVPTGRCSTPQVPSDQSPLSVRHRCVVPPTSLSSNPFSSDLGINHLTVDDQTPNRAQEMKLWLENVDRVQDDHCQMECEMTNSQEINQDRLSTSSPTLSSPSLPRKLFFAYHAGDSALGSPSILPTSLSHPATHPPHEGEVMSLHQALGGSQDSEEEEPDDQPVVIRSGVDPTDKCPTCNSVLETGPKAVNFSVNLSDMSVLVDCMVCGVRVKVKGALGERQRAFFSCGM